MNEVEQKIREAVSRFKAMPEAEKEAMLEQQRKFYARLTPARARDAIEEELSHVEKRLDGEKSWGAGVAALLEWRDDLKRELRQYDREHAKAEGRQ